MIAEAMACGVPVVASRCGSIPEVVGDASMLVQAADVLELAEAIERLRKEPELRSRLDRLGRRRAEERWNQNQTARRYEALYRALR